MKAVATRKGKEKDLESLDYCIHGGWIVLPWVVS
jgi:hypothetical protein